MNKLAQKLLTEKSYRSGQYLLSPEFLSLVITNKCNFQCQSCSVWRKEGEQELSFQSWLDIVENLKQSLDPKTFVELNGGEPLIRKDLVLTLVPRLKQHFNRVTLNSNGSLVDEKTVSLLEDAGLSALKISLYSYNRQTHDLLRGHIGSHSRATQAINLIAKSRINLEVGVLITRLNIREIPQLIENLSQLKNVNIILQPLDESIESLASKKMDRNELILDLWPDKKDVEDFFRWVFKNKKKIKNPVSSLKAMKKYYLHPESALEYRCFAGQRSIVIYPSADVALCFKSKAVGNLNNEKMPDILKGSRACAERKNISGCQKYCRIIGCNFSRGFREFIQDLL